MVRMSADERRESVIRAAVTEFARGGYSGTSTEAIAKRVGVSQPYLFRLFPNKQAIFIAAAARSLEETRRVLEDAAGEIGEDDDPVTVLANAYTKLIAEDPDKLLMQMQTQAAVAAAEAAGDHAFGEGVRAAWLALWDTVHGPLGADPEETTTFLAYGMLINSLLSMGFPPGHRVWQTLYPEATPEGPLQK